MPVPPPASRHADVTRRHRRLAALAALALLVAAGGAVLLATNGRPTARPAAPAAAAASAGSNALADRTPSAASAGRRAAPASAPTATPLLSAAELLAGHSPDWRVARLRDNPAVLVIEFPGLAPQGATMNRIAALLEKAGAPRDRVLGDTELAALIARAGDTAQTFYQGHDYNGDSLLRFFALAQHQRQPLNADEQRLRRLLLAEGLLAAGPLGLQAPGNQALITFTAIQSDDPATPGVDETVDERRRESVLLHESSHGRFYTRPVYREHCRHFWHDVLTEAQREQIRVYLASLGYERRDEELMLNEAQAFLLHTPDTRAFSAKAVGMTDDQLAALRTAFWRSLPPDGTGGAR